MNMMQQEGTRKEKNSARRGIQSVEIGMRVLLALAAKRAPTSLTAIAAAAQLSTSQTHRYLSSLMAAGMIQQMASGLYDLDAGAIRVGLAALSRLDVFAKADQQLSSLAHKSHRTVIVCVWGDAGPTVVRWYGGSPPILTALWIGSNLPLLCSSVGRVFYVFGARIEMDRQLDLLRIKDPASIPTNLSELVADIAKTGCSVSDQATIPGLRTTAAPVFDLQGNLVMVVTSLANEAFAKSDDPAAERALLQACRELTESFGGTWPLGSEDKAAARAIFADSSLHSIEL